MKKINKFYLLVLTTTMICSGVKAQVFSNNPVVNGAQGENAFLDGSTNFNDANSIGKGLIFPSTDLTNFVFKTNNFDEINFPTALNGMVVFNTTTGSTLSNVGGNNGIVTTVIPGFYYFSNPGQTTSVTSGQWLPLGSGSGTTTPVKAYSATESTAGVSVNGKEVFALTGTFTTLGTNALLTIAKPTGMTGYYKMTTYIGGKTFRNEISSFNIDPLVLVDNVVTGNGLFSEVYPAGTYTYTLEYFKS